MAIHIVTSGKGNVGKSSFSSALATVAATAGANPCLMDADDQKQTLSKLYGKGTARVKLSEDPVYEEQPDTIWYTAKKTGREVIVDLAAQTDLYINYWLDNRGILNAAESDNIRIIKWWVADLDPDSFVDLAALCKKYDSKQVTHVLVKSYYRGRDSLWLKTEEENDNLIEAKKNGLQVIEFPRMFEGLIDKLRAREQTFQQVLLDQKHEHTDMLNRSTVMNWMRSCTAQIEKIYQFTPDKTETQKPEGDEKNTTAKAKAKAKV